MKVALIGNLAGVSNELVLGLRNQGIEVDLYINQAEKVATLDFFKSHPSNRQGRLYFLEEAGFFRKHLHHIKLGLAIITKYDLVHSNTGSLNYCLIWHWLFVKLRLKKYLAFATGSDIREIAQFDKGLHGACMRAFFQKADKVLLLNTDMLAFKDALGLRSAAFFPFIINEEKFAPQPAAQKPGIYKNKLLCFMTSNLDFGITNNFPHRSSMKNNDRFFYALAEFIKKDTNIHALVVERGPDKEIAKKIVRDLALEDYITFIPPLHEPERIASINMADVVIDQFHMGSFGLLSLEALAIGKPLITYVKEDYAKQCYTGDLPILNALTKEDILARLLEARDERLRAELSAKARAWIIANHSRKVVIEKLIGLYRETLHR